MAPASDEHAARADAPATGSLPYDAVVVGSGFGGSVAACRLARAGQRVLLLERGKSYPPGSFPRTPEQMRANLWDPSAGLHGLFDFWSFRGLEALVSSGVGGGSLIYANVLLRMPAEWFARADAENGYAPWPITRVDLDPYYTMAEAMLGAQHFPDRPPYDACAKSRALADAAARIPGARFERPLLAVTFANAGSAPSPGAILTPTGPSYHGTAARQTCTLCGECDIGCNAGAKNTLDHNYLGSAQQAGAEIRERCEVREMRPLESGGFAVRYVTHEPGAEGRRTFVGGLPVTEVVARRLILAAGSLGTTFLLLKSRDRWFPKLDPLQLGTQFCGNGDLLTFARERPRGKGSGPLRPSHGPVITGAVRGALRGHPYCIEDGGIPTGLDWMLQMTSATSRLGHLGRVAFRYLRGILGFDSDSNLSAELSELFGPSRLPLLGMGRETPNGRLYLERGYLQSSWSLGRTRAFYRALEQQMAAITEAMGADFAGSPLRHLGRVVTVHPLGGCPMGRDAAEGIVDQWGESFAYPGLHVVDGAAMRGPVGVNPSLTIAAFAERCVEEIIRRG